MKESPGSGAWTRRRLLRRAGRLAAGAAVAPSLSMLMQGGQSAWAAGAVKPSSSLAHAFAPAAPLIDRVSAVCQRLAPAGWRDLFLKVSGNELDLAASDLAAVLA